MIVSLIVAYTAEERAIGYKGRLPWHLPADLARFKKLTMGHCLLMGRKTFESLEGRELPGRRIIVLSKKLVGVPDGADSLADSLTSALRQAQHEFNDSEAFIAGGAGVYRQALEMEVVNRMYVTLIQAKVSADTFFPLYNPEEWKVTQRGTRLADEKNRLDLTFLTLERARLPPAA